MRRRSGEVSLERALSKLGAASRAEARRRIVAGEVSVDGERITDPGHAVVPERADIRVDGSRVSRPARRVVLLHKPRGVVTTRCDPAGRPTVFDLLGEEAKGLVAVGRLDLATSGLLLLTSDTRLADALTDPANAVPRVYLVTVRGRWDEAKSRRLKAGLTDDGETLRASEIVPRKVSGRESHLVVTLTEGKNREVRRLFAAAGHEVTRLKRVAVGGLELGELPPGAFREADPAEVAALRAAASGPERSLDRTRRSP